MENPHCHQPFPPHRHSPSEFRRGSHELISDGVHGIIILPLLILACLSGPSCHPTPFTSTSVSLPGRSFPV